MSIDRHIEKALEILSDLREYFLYAKIGGSRALPFIKSPRDYDIIVISESLERRHQCARRFRERYDERSLFDECKLNFRFITIKDESNLIDSCYPYFVLRSDVIFSNDNGLELEDKPFSFFLASKDRILGNYRKAILRRRILKNNKYNNKIWYYLYATLCFIGNNCCDLTEEQIQNINILHDRESADLDKRKRLIDDMISVLYDNQEVENCILQRRNIHENY